MIWNSDKNIKQAAMKLRSESMNRRERAFFEHLGQHCAKFESSAANFRATTRRASASLTRLLQSCGSSNVLPVADGLGAHMLGFSSLKSELLVPEDEHRASVLPWNRRKFRLAIGWLTRSKEVAPQILNYLCCNLELLLIRLQRPCLLHAPDSLLADELHVLWSQREENLKQEFSVERSSSWTWIRQVRKYIDIVNELLEQHLDWEFPVVWHSIHGDHISFEGFYCRLESFGGSSSDTIWVLASGIGWHKNSD